MGSFVTKLTTAPEWIGLNPLCAELLDLGLRAVRRLQLLHGARRADAVQAVPERGLLGGTAEGPQRARAHLRTHGSVSTPDNLMICTNDCAGTQRSDKLVDGPSRCPKRCGRGGRRGRGERARPDSRPPPRSSPPTTPCPAWPSPAEAARSAGARARARVGSCLAEPSAELYGGCMVVLKVS